ncbi:Integrase catalytic domain-containing protein [Aphis craccivora]|uniref:Integrase catalytic domain-containing protein n=1 Tax=Aphis craccivora TaxID=307492 RepID=A0A6G0YVP1_APHCR|nr:Integrase catalytic domain-containing protein [Aphis craccivora]
MRLEAILTFAVINEKLNLILILKSSMVLGLIKRIDIPNKKNTSFSDISKIKLKDGFILKALAIRIIPIKIKDKFKTTLNMIEKKELLDISVNEPVDWVNRLRIVEKSKKVYGYIYEKIKYISKCIPYHY